MTRDGERFLLCLLDEKRDWPRLCRAFGLEGHVDDPRFATQEARADHASELVCLIDEVAAGRDLEEWAVRFREHDLVWGPVPTVQQLLSDRQMGENGVFAEVDHPTAGSVRTVNNPLEFDSIDKREPAPSPEVGQHTEEVLRELGYGDEAIGRLLEQKIVSKPEEPASELEPEKRDLP